MIPTVFNCTKNDVTVFIDAEISFDFMLLFAISPVASSQFHCTFPVAPMVFIVSRPFSVSIKIPFFFALASKVLFMLVWSGFLIKSV